MKPLFIGLGSIGQRHLRNFKELYPKQEEILAVRKSNHNLVIDGGAHEADVSLENHYNLTVFPNISDALKEKPEVAFITNPTASHIESAIAAAREGCHLFIEKPLSHNMERVDELREIAARDSLRVMVGYQTRFHPIYKFLKSQIQNKSNGRIISASFEWGTFLPQHHPYEDYRTGYAAKSSLGGGVTLGLIHEIDVICSLLGEPANIIAKGGKISSLECDVDDTICALMECNIDQKPVPTQLFLSYAQTKETRRIRIQFERTTVLADYEDASATAYDENGQAIDTVSSPDFDRNQLFIDELTELKDSIQKKRTPSPSLEDGARSLKIALEIKKHLL